MVVCGESNCMENCAHRIKHERRENCHLGCGICHGICCVPVTEDDTIKLSDHIRIVNELKALIADQERIIKESHKEIEKKNFLMKGVAEEIRSGNVGIIQDEKDTCDESCESFGKITCNNECGHYSLKSANAVIDWKNENGTTICQYDILPKEVAEKIKQILKETEK